MVDIVNNLARGDASAIVAVLLILLLASLRYISQGIFSRIETLERSSSRMARVRENHAIRLAIIENRVGVEAIEYHPEDNE